MSFILVYNRCRSFSIGHVQSSVRASGGEGFKAERKQQNLELQLKFARCWSCTKHRWDYVSSSSRMLGSLKMTRCGRNSRHQSEQLACASFLSIPCVSFSTHRESPLGYEVPLMLMWYLQSEAQGSSSVLYHRSRR